MSDVRARRTIEELAHEGGVALPAKEVISLLDLNANLDLALDLAAPIDLAVAANLNIAAPIVASVSANVLSIGSEAVAAAPQTVLIDQGITGTAEATAEQTAVVDQSDDAAGGTTTDTATGGTTDATDTGGTTGDLTSSTDDVAGAIAESAQTVAESFDGSLLNVDVDLTADLDIAAPIAGAVAANANVALPIDAAVAANVASIDSTATAVASQTASITQSLDGVEAIADADQTATVLQ